MAKLENLARFDHSFRLAANDFNLLAGTRGKAPHAWSKEQEVQFSQLMGCVRHMFEAIEQLVHQNR